MIVSPWIVQLIWAAFVVGIVEYVYLAAGGPRDTISIVQVALFALIGFLIVRRQARTFRAAKTLDDLWLLFRLPWRKWEEWPEETRRDATTIWSLMFAIIVLSLVRFFVKH